MSSDSHGLGISDFELGSLADLGAESSRLFSVELGSADLWEPEPPGLTEEGRDKWKAEQEDKKAKAQAEQAKREEETERRRQQAEDKFKAALDEHINRAYQLGSANAVSREALRAVSVRSYVLLGVVAAVVAMPLIAMFFKLDPQAFGAYIAPVTGITGTIVGYWFGTVGQATIGQGTTGQGTIGQGTTGQPSRPRSSRS
jgi:lipopolysaccharide export LptBFGC system permease protein LptF